MRAARAAVLVGAGLPAAALLAATLLLLVALAADAFDNRSLVDDLPITGAAWQDGAVGERLVAIFGQEFAAIADPHRRSRIARRLARELAATGELSPGFEECRRQARCAGLTAAERARLAFALDQALARLTLRHLARLLDRAPSPSGYLPVAENQRVFVPALQRTLLYAAVVAIACAAAGTVLGTALARSRARPLLAGALFLALATPHLVATVAWSDLARATAELGRWVAGRPWVIEPRLLVVAASVAMLVPLVALPVAGFASTVPRGLHELAMIDGAGRFARFRHVDWPFLGGAVGAGALLVFATTLGFFLVPELLGRPGDRPLAAFLAFYAVEVPEPGMVGGIGLATAASVVPLALSARSRLPRTTSEELVAEPAGGDRALPPGWTAAAVLLALVLVLPLSIMLGRTVASEAGRGALAALFADPAAAAALSNTLLLALAVAMLVAAAGLGIALAAFLRPGLLAPTLLAAGIYVALPDLVVAVGWLRLGAASGLPDAAVLVGAFLLHALPLGLAVLLGRLALLDRGIVDAARVDGADALAMLRFVLAPLLRPALLLAAGAAAIGVFTTSVLPIFLAGPRLPLTGWYLWTRLRDDFDTARAAAVLLALVAPLAGVLGAELLHRADPFGRFRPLSRGSPGVARVQAGSSIRASTPEAAPGSGETSSSRVPLRAAAVRAIRRPRPAPPRPEGSTGLDASASSAAGRGGP